MNSSISGEPVEQVIAKNRYGIRKLQAKFLQGEYEKQQSARQAERAAHLQQKQRQLGMLKQLNQTYLQDVSYNRKKKLNEMQSLSMEYEDFMRHKQDKQKLDKLIQKNIEQSTLNAPTWIRDVFTERDTYKKNMESYSRALADHVKLQQARKEVEKDEEDTLKRKINQEADAILRKDMQELEARHRVYFLVKQQKSIFQQRQNRLLGVSETPADLSSSKCQSIQATLKRKEQELYSQGLSVQLRKEQDRKFSQDRIAMVNSNVYNPITNPIPFVYKNPNVLRMMAQT